MTDGMPCGIKSGMQKRKVEGPKQNRALGVINLKPLLLLRCSLSSSPFLFSSVKVDFLEGKKKKKKSMVLAKVLFLIAIWLSVLNHGCSESGDVSEDVLPSPVACLNCTICQYPCHTPAPPSYGTPPPPPLPDFPLYGSPPPPPPPPRQPKGGCPPTPVVQCCQNPPPATNGYSPPATYGYPPPATYEYVPYNNFSASSSLQIFFFPSMISAFSFAALL